MKYKIYKLIENTQIIYIGRTTGTLKYRLSYHKHRKDGVSIHLVEETNNKEREIYWIKKFTTIQISQLTLSMLKGTQILYSYRDKEMKSLNDTLMLLISENENDIIK